MPSNAIEYKSTGIYYNNNKVLTTADDITTPASGTTGSIQFNNGTNIFTADSNLTWDNTNKRLGVGTSTPLESIHTTGTLLAKNNLSTTEYNNGNSTANTTINWNNGQYQKLTMTTNSNITFTNPTNGVGEFTLKLVQNNIGGSVPTLPTTLNLADGLSTVNYTSLATSVINIYFDGISYWARNIKNFISAKGYFGGGNSSLDKDKIDGFTFDTETFIDPVAALFVGRMSPAGVNSSTKGYFGGGGDGTSVFFDEIDGINFSTEAAINPVAVLSLARAMLTAVNSTIKGYFGGGRSGLGVRTNEIDGLDFSTENAINPTATLSTTVADLAGVNSTTKGYFGGGGYADSVNFNSSYNRIDGINFSTETAANPASTLSSVRQNLIGVNSTSKGYFVGGITTGNVRTNEIDGIDFSTEAAINPTATLGVVRISMAGANSLIKGYFVGGANGASQSSEVEGIDFSTEAAINPTVSVATRSNLTGVQSGGIL